MWVPNAWKNWKSRHMGVSFRWWLVSIHIPGSLPHARMPHKNTKSERLTDTIQLKHKRITNPTITQADKKILALADCVKALQGETNKKAKQELLEIKHLVKTTQYDHRKNDSTRITTKSTASKWAINSKGEMAHYAINAKLTTAEWTIISKGEKSSITNAKNGSTTNTSN